MHANENASIENFESRLVAQGFDQTEGLNYFERFPLVAKLSRLRVLLAVASLHCCHLHQLDVNNSFLQKNLMN